MAGIGSGVLQGDVFVGEGAGDVGLALGDRGDLRRRCGGDGGLLGWGAMVRVLEDAWEGISFDRRGLLVEYLWVV